MPSPSTSGVTLSPPLFVESHYLHQCKTTVVLAMDDNSIVSQISVTAPSYYSTTGSSIRDDAPINAALDMKALFSVLLQEKIPGPRLIRLRSEFSEPLGHGGEGIVYGASDEYVSNIQNIAPQAHERIHYSVQVWRNRVVKRLRSDGTRPYADQVRIAYSEIRRLCDESFRKHPNIVKLKGWGICLDSLEDRSESVPLMPLLILERARCDLDQFIKSPEYEKATYDDLCGISRDMGSGLGAVHQANIAHGDMKPANVLLFLEFEELPYAKMKWTAKLCDFGSAAIESTGKPRAFQKRGTYHYWPPEYWIAECTVGASAPESLRACDIFAYGLVVWNLFAGMPFPPLSVDDSKEIALGKLGQQEYYRRASESLRGLYNVERQQTVLLLVESIRLPLISISARAHGTVQRQRHHRARRARYALPDKKALELEVNRILIVLRGCLNDNPTQRDDAPWRYFNAIYYPTIPSVSGPLEYLPTENPSRQDPHSHNFNNASFSAVARNIKAATDRMSALTAQNSSGLNSKFLGSMGAEMWQRLKIWIPALRPGSQRQRIVERLYNDVRKDLPIGWQTHDIRILAHGAEHGCYNLNIFRNYTVGSHQAGIADSISETIPQQSRYATVADHRLYAFARLRSRLKKCCWLNSGLADWPSLPELWSWPAMIDVATLAWLLRGEVGESVLQHFQQKDAASIWIRLFENARWMTDEDLSLRVLLLLERGCSLQLRYRHGDFRGTQGPPVGPRFV